MIELVYCLGFTGHNNATITQDSLYFNMKKYITCYNPEKTISTVIRFYPTVSTPAKSMSSTMVAMSLLDRPSVLKYVSMMVGGLSVLTAPVP